MKTFKVAIISLITLLALFCTMQIDRFLCLGVAPALFLLNVCLFQLAYQSKTNKWKGIFGVLFTELVIYDFFMNIWENAEATKLYKDPHYHMEVDFYSILITNYEFAALALLLFIFFFIRDIILKGREKKT
jgi:hypothetical protein